MSFPLLLSLCRYYRWPVALVVSVTVWTAGLLTAVQAPIVWAPSDVTTALGGILTGLAWSSAGLWLYFLKDQPTFYAQRTLIQAAAIAVLLTQGVWLQASWLSVATGYLTIKVLIGLSYPKKLEPVSGVALGGLSQWPHRVGPAITRGVLILSVAWLLFLTFFPSWALGLLIPAPAVISVYGLALMGYAFATFRLFCGPIAPPSVGLTGWGLVTGLDVLLYAAALLATLQPFSLTSAGVSSAVINTMLLVILSHSVALSCVEQWKRCLGSVHIKRHHHTAHQQLHVDLAVKTIQLEQEVATRRKAQEELHKINQDLEQQVQLRTADMEMILQELGQVNAQMESELNERKVLESQLVQAQKMESVGQLAAGVAHEINNPVGFILSNLRTLDEYVQLLQQLLNHYEDLETSLMQAPLGELGDNEDLVRPILNNLATFRKNEDIGFILQDLTGLLAESIDGSNRVKEIVQGLKSFSRIDESTLQQVDLHECIESTLKVVWNEVKYKCNVIKHYDAQLPPLLCYPGQLNQVFLNLLVNAAQAIEQRGDITIATRTETFNDTPHIVIEITDTGAGIPAKLLTKIFDPFFTTKPVGSGSGLGLAISYGIVHKHQGTLSVQSTVGKGTVFTIALPINALTPTHVSEPPLTTSGVPSYERQLLSPVAA